MPARRLYDLAKLRLIKNIHMLDDIGDLPYTMLGPVLKEIQNPDQLAALEAKCPQIQGQTGEIWTRLIQRDIPDWDKKPHQPRDPKNWPKVYRKLKRDAERENEEQSELLKKKMLEIANNRKGNQTTIVESRTGYKGTPRATGRMHFGAGNSWGQPAPPSKTGKQAFDKLKRGMFDQKQARTQTQAPPRIGTVAQAPARMVRILERDAAPRNKAAPGGASTPAATRAPNPQSATQKAVARTNEAPPRKSNQPGLPLRNPPSAASQKLTDKRPREVDRVLVQPKRRKG